MPGFVSAISVCCATPRGREGAGSRARGWSLHRTGHTADGRSHRARARANVPQTRRADASGGRSAVVVRATDDNRRKGSNERALATGGDVYADGDLLAPEFLEVCEAQVSLLEHALDVPTKVTVYLRVLDSFESGSLELRKAWPVVKDDTSAAAMGRALQSAAAQAPGGSEVRTDAAAEAVLMQTDCLPLPNTRAVVVPVRRMGFLVGLLVARAETDSVYSDGEKRIMVLVADTVAAVWALDQKSALLGRSTASRNQQLKRLVEQVSAPLSALRTLGYFLQDRMRPQEEAAQDLVDNLVIQGDRLQEVAEQLQAALYPDATPPRALNFTALLPRGRDRATDAERRVEQQQQQQQQQQQGPRLLKRPVWPGPAVEASSRALPETVKPGVTRRSDSDGGAGGGRAWGEGWATASVDQGYERGMDQGIKVTSARGADGTATTRSETASTRPVGMRPPPTSAPPAPAAAAEEPLAPKDQCNVTDVLGVLLAGLEGLARNQSVEVTWEVEGSQGRRLPDAGVNPYELRKVLATVLDAALDQAAPGGSIHLALSATPPLSPANPVVDIRTTVRCASGGGGTRQSDGSWRVSLTLAMQQAACMDGSLTVEMLPYPAGSAPTGTDSIDAAPPATMMPQWNPERGFDWQGMVGMVGFMDGGSSRVGGEVWSIVLRLTVPAAPAKVQLKRPPVWPGSRDSSRD